MTDQDRLKHVAEETDRIYRETVAHLAERFAFDPGPRWLESQQPPLVLLIGNHSSGKSSFLNTLLGEEVQKTGLAPVDDSFTILTRGPEPVDLDGAAVVSNSDLPYSGLESFGPGLVSHLAMKRRSCEILETITLIDSPGMIDNDRGSQERGYDFPKVVRWFADRADVILLFFDPDKPGTTGETLQILEHALADMDHKVLLVLNKVDRFSNMRDFARAYGALCWNLSRTIARKDLPHIYTMYLEGHDRPNDHLPLDDFDRAREEVLEKVRNAPTKRLDNIITRLYEHGRGLLVHARVCDAARRKHADVRWKLRGALLLFALLGGGVTYLTAQGDGAWGVGVGLGAALLLAGAFAVFRMMEQRFEEEILAGLTRVFDHAFANELALSGRRDDLEAIWARVKPRTHTTLSALGLRAIPRLRAHEAAGLEKVVREVVPELRARIHAPAEAAGASAKS